MPYQVIPEEIWRWTGIERIPVRNPADNTFHQTSSVSPTWFYPVILLTTLTDSSPPRLLWLHTSDDTLRPSVTSDKIERKSESETQETRLPRVHSQSLDLNVDC
ncbi:hypothetical protein BYT27DRAFT_6744461 [Phlegmacium glaucopus]|nr:hypothetical protein BYT27DRAFT_6744461 [Phlegmacium glaucopus]